jgi:hypothetical protein
VVQDFHTRNHREPICGRSLSNPFLLGWLVITSMPRYQSIETILVSFPDLTGNKPRVLFSNEKAPIATPEGNQSFLVSEYLLP